jgi:hypothetical protein
VIATFANKYTVTTMVDDCARIDFRHGLRENDADAELCAQVYLPPGGLEALRGAIDEIFQSRAAGRKLS